MLIREWGNANVLRSKIGNHSLKSFKAEHHFKGSSPVSLPWGHWCFGFCRLLLDQIARPNSKHAGPRSRHTRTWDSWGLFGLQQHNVALRCQRENHPGNTQNISLHGGFLKRWYPQDTPKWSCLVGKPMFVGYHHFRKHPHVHSTFAFC